MSARRILTIAIAALVCLLLLGSAAAAGSPASAGGYRLAASPWQVEGSAHGAGYVLQGQSSLLQAGPCCCTYLPCITRGWP